MDRSIEQCSDFLLRRSSVKICILGRSNSQKSTIALEMLENYGVIFNAQRLQYLWIFYKVFQDIYLKMKNCVEGGNVVFTQGLPADSDFGIKPETDDVGKLVFIDDL